MSRQVMVYIFCGGCGKEVESSCYPDKSILCGNCQEERHEGGKIEAPTGFVSNTLSAHHPINMSSFNITPERSFAPVLPKRTNGGGIAPEAYMTGVSRELFPPRVDTSVPHYASFEGVPTSLPAPRHRDVMNETKQQRFKNDLAELRGHIQASLVQAIDKRRRGVYYEEPERSEYLHKVDEEENKLWIKLEAVELLMKE